MNNASATQRGLLQVALAESLVTKKQYEEAITDSVFAYKIIGIAKNKALGKADGLNIKHLDREAFREVTVYDNNRIGANELFTSKWGDSLGDINCKDDMYW